MKSSVVFRIRISTTLKGHSCRHETWFHTGGYRWWRCEWLTKTYIHYFVKKTCIKGLFYIYSSVLGHCSDPGMFCKLIINYSSI